MNEIQERHYCINCNWELTEDETFETFSSGCPYCGEKKGFITLSNGMQPFKLPDTYLDNYLLSRQIQRDQYGI